MFLLFGHICSDKCFENSDHRWCFRNLHCNSEVLISVDININNYLINVFSICLLLAHNKNDYIVYNIHDYTVTNVYSSNIQLKFLTH